MDKADFTVKLEGNTLTISSAKKEEKTEAAEKSIRKEFSYRSFKRSFTVDEKIDAGNINAKYENGILKLDLPKKKKLKWQPKKLQYSKKLCKQAYSWF